MLWPTWERKSSRLNRPRCGDDSRQWGPVYWGNQHLLLIYQQNKKSLGLNLKTEEGRRILWKLNRAAEVVIRTSGRASWRSWDLDTRPYRRRIVEQCIARSPGSVTTGPYRDRPAMTSLPRGVGL